jgi:hypothetical protein
MADDIRENAMAGGTPARLRGLAANGNSISPTLEEVASAMPVATETNKGLMPANGIIYKGSLGENSLEDVGSSFGYAYGTKDGSNIAGPFLSLRTENGACFQIKAEYACSSLKFRVYNQITQKWSSWKSITFT